MPAVVKGETKEEFIARAIRHMMKHEGMRQDHAVAKAHGMWRQYMMRRAKHRAKAREK